MDFYKECSQQLGKQRKNFAAEMIELRRSYTAKYDAAHCLHAKELAALDVSHVAKHAKFIKSHEAELRLKLAEQRQKHITEMNSSKSNTSTIIITKHKQEMSNLKAQHEKVLADREVEVRRWISKHDAISETLSQAADSHAKEGK